MPKYTDTRGLRIRRARWHYDNDVGTVEVLVPEDHLIFDPYNPQGTPAGRASVEVFKNYAMRLLLDAGDKP